MTSPWPGVHRWRLLHSPPADGPTNMAIDHSLVTRAARSGEAVIRVYSWAVPTLSLGRNQRARGCYDLGAIAERGIAVVRRPTGGRAILHHREVTYSVTAPLPPDEPLARTYARFNGMLIAALRQLGVDAQLAAPIAATPLPGLAPCFDSPARGEVEWHGRKLAGSAQWRDGSALLQHGSILVDDDQWLLATLTRETVAPPAAATLRDALGHAPTTADLADALATAAAAAFGTPPEPLAAGAPDAQPEAALVRLYCDDNWTWRR